MKPPHACVHAPQVSLQLAMLNALPVPPLDGGKALAAVLGASALGRRMQPSPAVQQGVMAAGAICTAGVLLTLTLRDVWELLVPQQAAVQQAAVQREQPATQRAVRVTVAGLAGSGSAGSEADSELMAA